MYLKQFCLSIFSELISGGVIAMEPLLLIYNSSCLDFMQFHIIYSAFLFFLCISQEESVYFPSRFSVLIETIMNNFS